MANDNPIKYSDLIQPDDSIDALIKKLDELSNTYMNLSENIKKNALGVKASLEGVSGATEQGRKTIREAADDTERLNKALKDQERAESDVAKMIAQAKLATQNANAEAKLQAKLANSAAGSYDALSAQYSLNKMRLNAMSAAERSSTEEGQKLEAETKAIYEEMKRLQEATGKHQLNVGNYAEATVGLRSQIMQLTEELVRMRMEGKQDTEEYQQMSKKAAELKDAFTDAQAEIKNMASDTSALNSVMGAATAASGGFTAVTGAMKLFGDESDDVQEAQKKLQAAIAVTSGLTAIQNQLQHQSNLMLGISRLQDLAAAQAKALNTKQTVAATAAQRVFNAVAKANPYVLLAMALITVVGALVAFSKGTSEAAKNQAKLNDVEKSHLDYLDHMSGRMVEASKERTKELQRELDLARARGASDKEIREIEDQMLAERAKANAEQRGYYSGYLSDLDANKKKLDALKASLDKLNEAKATGSKETSFEINGEIKTVKIEDAIEAVQGQIDNLGRKVEIAATIKAEGEDIAAEREKIAAERVRQDRETEKKVTDTLRQAEDDRLALISNGYARQRAQASAATKRAIEDIQYQLDTEANLTDKQRAALTDRQLSLKLQLAQALKEIDRNQAAAELATRRETEDMKNSLMEEGAEKQRIILATSYQRQLEDLDIQLANESDLTLAQKEELAKQRLLIEQQYLKDLKDLKDQEAADTLSREAEMLQMQIDMAAEGTQEQQEFRMHLIENQRQQELAANRQLAEDKRRDEADINAKYDAEALKQRQEFELAQFDLMQQEEASEFALLNKSENTKTKFALQQEKARLQKILELNLTSAKKMSDEEVRIIENQIKRIQQDIDSITPKDIYDVFGLELNDDQKSAISDSMQYAMDALNQWMDLRVQAAEKAVQAADKEVDAAQRAYELELEAKANGYAADVETSKKELELAKQNQKKALDQQKEAQAQREKLQTIEQAMNLITGISRIWAAFGEAPYVAIALTALMLGSFAASKIMAVQAAKEQYAEGHVELLQGGSHASGNDIDLGTKADGTRRRAEGGEFFAVINKRNSRRFRKEIPEVIGSLNDGTFADKYLNAFNIGAIGVAEGASATDLTQLNENVEAIKEQGARRYIVTGDGLVMEYKNLRRRVI